MGNRRLMMLFAALFSIVFSIVYYFLFTMTLTTNTTNEKRVLYMNQVGLYKKSDSIAKMQKMLQSNGLKSYVFKQDDLTAVVCSVSSKEKETKADQKKLSELQLHYLVKKVTVDNAEIVKLIDKQQYAQALERIGK